MFLFWYQRATCGVAGASEQDQHHKTNSFAEGLYVEDNVGPDLFFFNRSVQFGMCSFQQWFESSLTGGVNMTVKPTDRVPGWFWDKCSDPDSDRIRSRSPGPDVAFGEDRFVSLLCVQFFRHPRLGGLSDLNPLSFRTPLPL